jgi:hypothetical protein
MTETTTTKMVLRMPRMQCRHAGPKARGGRFNSLGSPVHPRVILPPPRGGGVVVIKGRWSGGEQCHVHLAPPWKPHLTSANDNDKTTMMNTTANTTMTKTKMAMWLSSASRGHASSKPPMPKEDNMIWQLRSRFGGNRWYSETTSDAINDQLTA